MDLISRAVISGLQQERKDGGEDIGADEELPLEETVSLEEEIAAPKLDIAETVTEEITSAN